MNAALVRDDTESDFLALVAGAAAGDSACFDALYRQCAGRVYALALRSTGDPAEAEDVCQEAWSRVHHSIGGLRNPEAFGAWLTRIAVRACVDAARHHREQPLDDAEAEALPDSDPDLADGLTDREDGQLAWQALAALSTRQRVALYLREVEGRCYREIGVSLGTSEAAVETLLFRARRSLAVSYGRLEASPEQRCGQARRLMAVVLDGEGDAAQARSLQAHLRDCHACQAAMFAQRRGKAAYAALPFAALASQAPALLPAAGGGASGLLGLIRLALSLTRAASLLAPAAVAATLAVAVSLAPTASAGPLYGPPADTAPAASDSASAVAVPPSTTSLLATAGLGPAGGSGAAIRQGASVSLRAASGAGGPIVAGPPSPPAVRLPSPVADAAPPIDIATPPQAEPSPPQNASPANPPVVDVSAGPLPIAPVDLPPLVTQIAPVDLPPVVPQFAPSLPALPPVLTQAAPTLPSGLPSLPATLPQLPGPAGLMSNVTSALPALPPVPLGSTVQSLTSPLPTLPQLPSSLPTLPQLPATLPTLPSTTLPSGTVSLPAPPPLPSLPKLPTGLTAPVVPVSPIVPTVPVIVPQPHVVTIAPPVVILPVSPSLPSLPVTAPSLPVAPALHLH